VGTSSANKVGLERRMNFEWSTQQRNSCKMAVESHTSQPCRQPDARSINAKLILCMSEAENGIRKMILKKRKPHDGIATIMKRQMKSQERVITKS
jgi:hypothetical protein